MNNTIPLVRFLGLDDRKPYQFNIPHYQRGYRWGEQEITELLDDLWEFQSDQHMGDFYCLQPIVVKKNEKDSNLYDVLDGQQRLTTLYLILVYLEDRMKEDSYFHKLFDINYETRPGSKVFLNSREFIRKTDDSNIDYYHICNAYNTIDNWFKKSNHAGAKSKLLPILLDDNGKGNRNLRFIWYEVDKKVSSIEIFIRLNVGKIPLTDAELTKALLLQTDKYKSDLAINKKLSFVKGELKEIATEWDNIEYTLQNEDFWFFINNNTNDHPTHIELIFDLIANKLNNEFKFYMDKENKPQKPKNHPTFLILSSYLKHLVEVEKADRIKAVRKIWDEVGYYFDYFNAWYSNRMLYHYIGFLIVEKGSKVIEKLIEVSHNSTKSEFQEYLRKEIGNIIRVNKKRKITADKHIDLAPDTLKYEYDIQNGNDKQEITKILFIHNVHRTLCSTKEKAMFPFYLYKQTQKNEKWSLEHIHAQNSTTITSNTDKKMWLKDHIISLSNIDKDEFSSQIEEMKNLISQDKIGDVDFDNIVINIMEILNQKSNLDMNDMHSISNLCLIDKNTNSQLNNSVFDVKREKIKKREFEGFYIPLCTRNIFLKAYTNYPKNNVYWTEEDRTDYLTDIMKTYNEFTS